MKFKIVLHLALDKHEGNKPISIAWRMKYAQPKEILSEGRKMAVG
jgi:hypothetical protein